MMRVFALVVLVLALFGGGIVLMRTSIPFWSLFLGIMAVQSGIVLVILAFDFVLRLGKSSVSEYKTVPCLVCGSPTFVPKYINVSMCDNCQVRSIKGFKAAGILTIFMFVMSAGVFLLTRNQNISEKAYENFQTCEMGEWSPADCRCGVWIESVKTKRLCKDQIIRSCFEKPSGYWSCL